MCREWKCSGRKWRRGCRTGCWSAPHRRTSSTRTGRGGTTSACTRRSRKACPTWARCRPRTCSSSRASPTSTAPAHGGAERRAPQRQERAARRAARRAAAAEALAAAVTAAQGPGGVHGQAIIETKLRALNVTQEVEKRVSVPRPVRMYWTGCPNSCGQVQVAAIGFMGCLTKDSSGKIVEAADIFVGGRIVGRVQEVRAVRRPCADRGRPPGGKVRGRAEGEGG
jgi:hypothetical protein